MSEFNDIITYLRFSRRSEEAQAKNKNRIAIHVDSEFDNNIPHEDDIVVIKKSALANGTDYRRLNDVANTFVTTLYIVDDPNGSIEYYIKKEFKEEDGLVSKYRRVPLSESTNEDIWENKDNTVFTAVNVTSDFYYRPEDQKVYMVFSEDAFLFPDTFIYDPKDLPIDSAYEFDYINADGYDNSAWDNFLLKALHSRSHVDKAKLNRIVQLQKQPNAKIVNLFPRIENTGNRLQLHYNYYEKGVAFDSKGIGTPAITLSFRYVGALLEFLNKTIFYILDEKSDFHTNLRKIFIDNYNWLVSDLVRYNKGDALLALFYYLPNVAFQHLDELNLWDTVDYMLESPVTNFGLDKETILLKLLEVLYQNSKTDQIFLKELLKENAGQKTRLERLIYRLDGDSNTKLIKLVYDIWKGSKFILPDEEQVPEYKDTDGPLFLPYESEKWAGFYFSNTDVAFNKASIEIVLDTGEEEQVLVPSITNDGILVDQVKTVPITVDYTYHPFYPIYIKNLDKQDTTISFDTVIPAFMLYANEDKAFWHNFVKTGEYVLDAATTLSGIGNLAKLRHLTKLARLAKAAEGVTGTAKLVKSANILRYIKGAAGVVEISSGSVNLMLKLTEKDETEFGKSLSKVLFYLELITLSGEIIKPLKTGLQKRAKEVVKSSDTKTRNLNEELFKELNAIAYNTRLINISELEKFLKENGILDKIDLAYIEKICFGRTDLAESLLLSLKQVRSGKTVEELVSIFKITDPPKTTSLTNYEARIWYTWKKSKIEQLIFKEKRLETKAKKAFELRNQYRSATRKYMKDHNWAQFLEEVEKNMTWEEILRRTLKKDKISTLEEAYNYIIETSKKGRDGVDLLFKIN